MINTRIELKEKKMNASLKTIQTLSRIAKVVSALVFVFSIIGAIGSAVGLIGIVMIDVFGISEESLSFILELDKSFTVESEYYVTALALIYCIGNAIVSSVAKSYFQSELHHGTPFTARGAAELRRVSVFAIVVPIAVSFAQSIAIAGISLFVANTEMIMPYETDISIGIFLLILSVIFKYGADISEPKSNAQTGV